MAIRLGGIYALERIAKDHRQVMEVLTPTYRKTPAGKGERDENGVPVSDESEKHRVSTDIQAILTVLGRRRVRYDPPEHGLDLVDTDLRGTILRNGNLQGAYLYGANLEAAFAILENLQGAFLSGARLNGAHLQGARLSGAINLTQEQIESAITDEDTILPNYLKRG